jgi:hypothetical protein
MQADKPLELGIFAGYENTNGKESLKLIEEKI